MKHRLAITPLLLGLAACAPAVPDAPTYERDVKPILDANCARCHGPRDATSYCFRVDSWTDTPDELGECGTLVGVSHENLAVDPPFIVREEIVRRAAVEGDMPPDTSLTSRQKDILRAWRDAGFPRGDAAPQPDAGTGPLTPSVTLVSPAGGELLREGVTAQIRWIADGFDPATATIDVVARTGGDTIAIATALAATPGVAASTDWSLVDVPLAADYRVEVTLRDGAGEPLAADTSGAFEITGAASFAADVLPALAGCVGTSCHDGVGPAGGLSLLPDVAYGNLVAQASQDCGTAVRLVEPGQPDDSYLVWKLEGTDLDACYSGTRMPRGQNPLSVTQMHAIRSWIAAGALDN